MSQEVCCVLKFGGELVANPDLLQPMLREVAELTQRGEPRWRCAIVHGAGPQAASLQRRLGMQPRRVQGRRVTDAPTLQVMKQVLAGEANVDLTMAAMAAGLRATGITGASFVRARRAAPIVVDGQAVDYGFVGVIEQVDVELIKHLWQGGFTPVISPLGACSDRSGQPQVLNINADTVASALACALGADHLFLATTAGGVLRDIRDPASRIARLSPTQARDAIAQGVIAGGMIPKVADALRYLEQGPGGSAIGVVHILGVQRTSLAQAAKSPGLTGTALTGAAGRANV